ncbi:MAG: LytTR family DNA-binding domain-containing protein [Bacteroidota bacterium]
MKFPYKTILVDDEELARERLKRLLTSFSEYIEIIGEAVDGNQAEKQIEALKPDLVFLDIQMPGKNIFEVLKDLKHKPIIVFCTAYDQFALKAFESFSLDYILKPVEIDRINQTIEKLKRVSGTSNLDFIIQHLSELQQPKPKMQSISHKVGDRIVLVKTEEITFLNADNKYVNFYNANCKEYITEHPLKVLEEKLPDQFIRVSKSHIINISFVKEIQRYFRGKFLITIDDRNRTKITTGSSFQELIKTKFDL